jgi:hypothetical protein
MWQISYLVVTLQQSGVSMGLFPKDPNLQVHTIVATRVAHNLVMYDKLLIGNLLAEAKVL